MTTLKTLATPCVLKDVVYGSVLGAGLVADVGVPGGSGPFPVVLSVHGGRWIRGTRQDNGAIDVKRWSEEFGFFSVAIDYRLVTCCAAPACYEDVLCAIRWVRAHATEYNLDLSRFYLIGQSAGGHMVSLAATLGLGDFKKAGGWEDQSHEFTAGICVSGAYDLVTLDWGSGWLPAGVPWDIARTAASPLTHVKENLKKPLLILHSDDDHSVPVKQAVNFVNKLKEYNNDVTFLHYKDKGHMLLSEQNIHNILLFIKNVQLENTADHSDYI